LDGALGEVFIGNVAMIEPAMSTDFATLMEWADKATAPRMCGPTAETPAGRRDYAKKYVRRRHRPLSHPSTCVLSILSRNQRSAPDDHGA